MRPRFMRVLQIGLATLIATATLGVVANPAQAVTSCTTSGALCIWTGANYTGTRHVVQEFPCDDFTTADGKNNNTTSLKVNANATGGWTLYLSHNCEGEGGYIWYAAGTSIADLASAVDNQFSSAG